MDDRSSEEYSPSPDEINARGRKLHGHKWTGREVSARALPQPTRTFRKIKEARDAIRRERAEAAKQEAEKRSREQAEHLISSIRAAKGVREGPVYIGPRQRSRTRPSSRPLSSRFPLSDEIAALALLWEVEKRTGLSQEVVTAAQDEAAYREEYGAARRCKKIIIELQSFKPEGSNVVTTNSERQCREWLATKMRNGPPEKTKAEYQSEARSLFKVGSNAFSRSWANAITDTGNTEWSKPGPKSIPPDQNPN